MHTKFIQAFLAGTEDLAVAKKFCLRAEFRVLYRETHNKQVKIQKN